MSCSLKRFNTIPCKFVCGQVDTVTEYQWRRGCRSRSPPSSVSFRLFHRQFSLAVVITESTFDPQVIVHARVCTVYGVSCRCVYACCSRVCPTCLRVYLCDVDGIYMMYKIWSSTMPDKRDSGSLARRLPSSRDLCVAFVLLVGVCALCQERIIGRPRRLQAHTFANIAENAISKLLTTPWIFRVQRVYFMFTMYLFLFMYFITYYLCILLLYVFTLSFVVCVILHLKVSYACIKVRDLIIRVNIVASRRRRVDFCFLRKLKQKRANT